MRALLIVSALLWATGAQGHAFFDRWCCSGNDCAAAVLGSVKWTPGGWMVDTPSRFQFGKPIHDLVPPEDERIRYVPVLENQQFYICEYPVGHLRCLYVPESGG